MRSTQKLLVDRANLAVDENTSRIMLSTLPSASGFGVHERKNGFGRFVANIVKTIVRYASRFDANIVETIFRYVLR